MQDLLDFFKSADSVSNLEIVFVPTVDQTPAAEELVKEELVNGNS